jgi:hypothetical protein
MIAKIIFIPHIILLMSGTFAPHANAHNPAGVFAGLKYEVSFICQNINHAAIIAIIKLFQLSRSMPKNVVSSDAKLRSSPLINE